MSWYAVHVSISWTLVALVETEKRNIAAVEWC